jgi:hypothetical protein
MPTLRANDTPLNVRLPAGEALIVNAPSGSTATVTSKVDFDPAASVSGVIQTFGPYPVAKVIELACTVRSVSYFTAVVSTGTVAASRVLTDADNGKVLECTATATLTVPVGLKAGFRCTVLCSGTTSVASSGGTLLNGATSTLTRAVASNPAIDIIARASAQDSYVVTGS